MLSIYAADVRCAKGERRVGVDLNQSFDESRQDDLGGLLSQVCERRLDERQERRAAGVAFFHTGYRQPRLLSVVLSTSTKSPIHLLTPESNEKSASRQRVLGSRETVSSETGRRLVTSVGLSYLISPRHRKCHSSSARMEQNTLFAPVHWDLPKQSVETPVLGLPALEHILRDLG